MEQKNLDKNWVSKGMLLIMGASCVLLNTLAVVFSSITMLAAILGILGLIMLLMFICFAYARYKMSPSGGDVQGRISAMLLQKLPSPVTGRLLDVGCGSGILSVQTAIENPEVRVDGIDYWGGVWGYSKAKCENLAGENNVSDRITFTKGSASALPFAGETFDCVISNMVFHEVADAKDKREVIKEALRTLKVGGTFAFQDLFKNKKLYGDTEDLVEYVKNLGMEVQFEETGKAAFVPALLSNPMFFGSAAILWGKKIQVKEL